MKLRQKQKCTVFLDTVYINAYIFTAKSDKGHFYDVVILCVSAMLGELIGPMKFRKQQPNRKYV